MMTLSTLVKGTKWRSMRWEIIYSGKWAKARSDKTGDESDMNISEMITDINVLNKSNLALAMIPPIKIEEDKEVGGNEDEKSEGKLILDDSNDDLLSSQEHEDFAKYIRVIKKESQESGNEKKGEDTLNEEFQVVNNGRGKTKIEEQADGVRRSTRLETTEYIKVTNKAISRA